MGIRELNLTKEQHEWLNGWLELWGAWVYSGRLEKRMSSVIAKFMESVEPGRVMTRPMCNDDDGMLISQVVDSVMYIDKKAFGILLSYYAHDLPSTPLHLTIIASQDLARCYAGAAGVSKTIARNLSTGS